MRSTGFISLFRMTCIISSQSIIPIRSSLLAYRDSAIVRSIVGGCMDNGSDVSANLIPTCADVGLKLSIRRPLAVFPVETKQFYRPRRSVIWSVATIPESSIFMNSIWRAVTPGSHPNGKCSKSPRQRRSTLPTSYLSITLSHAMKSHARRILSVRKFRRELEQFPGSLEYDSFKTKRWP